MSLPNDSERVRGATTGWEGLITGTLSPVSGAPTLADLENAQKLLTSALLPVGTHYFAIPVAGCLAVDVTLRKSAGTITSAELYKTQPDHVTEKLDAAGASAKVAFGAFVNGTSQIASIDDLRGERIVLLKIVIAVATQFDQAFYSAL